MRPSQTHDGAPLVLNVCCKPLIVSAPCEPRVFVVVSLPLFAANRATPLPLCLVQTVSSLPPGFPWTPASSYVTKGQPRWVCPDCPQWRQAAVHRSMRWLELPQFEQRWGLCRPWCLGATGGGWICAYIPFVFQKTTPFFLCLLQTGPATLVP